MRWSLSLPVVALIASCHAALPSTVPLGRGPLAAPASEDAPRVIEAKRHKPDEKFEVAGASDAGAKDASVATTKKPTSKDAGADAADGATVVASEDASASGPFAGDYHGKDVTELHVQNMPSGKQEDPKARITVVAKDDGSLAFKLIASNDGSTICTLTAAKPTGNATTITAGQHCFDTSGGPMQATIRTGSATFTGPRLVFVLGMDLTIAAPGMQTSGTMDYSFDGTRS